MIVDYRAGMSAKASKLFLPMQRVVIDGPTQAAVDSFVTFTITVDAPNATAPFTYTYAATDVLTDSRTTQSSDALLTYRWPTSGSKTIDVTVENELGSVSSRHTVLIGDVTVTPAPTPSVTPEGTPSPSVTPEVTPTPSITPTPGSLGGGETVYLPLVNR